MGNIDPDIRWQQRFENFQRAYKLLEANITIAQPNELERAGIIQFFEMAFELGWKLIKDYLQAEGFSIASPRGAIKEGFQAGIIKDGHSWIKALDDRNLTTHTYDEQTAIEIVQRIKQEYCPALRELYLYFKDKI